MTEPLILAEFENAEGRTTITLEQHSDGAIRLCYHDAGEAARRIHASEAYEAWVTIPADQLAKLAFALLADKFQGDRSALSQLRAFCETHGVRADSGAWT